MRDSETIGDQKSNKGENAEIELGESSKDADEVVIPEESEPKKRKISKPTTKEVDL